MTSLYPQPPAVQSMTGYGSAQRDCAAGRVSLELKSVNSRFFELNARIPDELRWLEQSIRETLQQHVQRGKVELRLAMSRSESHLAATQINAPGLASALRLSHQIRQDHPEVAPFSVAELLKTPGVTLEPELSAQQWQDLVAGLVQEALERFIHSRATEGARLAQTVSERLDRIQALAEQARRLLPEAISHQQQRLTEKLKECLTSAASSDPSSKLGAADLATALAERIRQEIAVFGLRIDVAEELDRLGAHVAAARQALRPAQEMGGVGKRLDFLAQEMNREANTLGSKSSSTELSGISIELKLLIEQIREQTQNLQ